MKGKKKSIKFTYYEVVSLVNENEVLYDLLNWLYKISGITIENRIRLINGVQGRLEDVKIIGNDFYALNFMRLDEASDAYKVKESNKAQHIDLDDDEYLGRNTVALYDPKKHIILIQNNRGSYSANAIQNYINGTNDGDICYFKPMIDAFDVNRCKNGRIKRLIATCSAVNDFRPENSKNFERLITSCRELGGYTFHIDIGIGYGKDKALNNQSVYEDVNVLLQNRNCLSTAKVELADDEISGVFDLFDNLHIGKFDIMVPDRGELDFLHLAKNMYTIYINENKEG